MGIPPPPPTSLSKGLFTWKEEDRTVEPVLSCTVLSGHPLLTKIGNIWCSDDPSSRFALASCKQPLDGMLTETFLMAYKGNTNLDIFSLALYENMFNAWPSVRFLC